VTDPPVTEQVGLTLGLLNRRLRFSGLLDRQYGFLRRDETEVQYCERALCRASVDPTASIDAIERIQYLYAIGGAGIPKRGDFTRLRELGVTLDVPQSLAARFGSNHASINLSVRNVHLWSRFGVFDPESVGESIGENNAMGDRASGIPQSKTWVLRFDLGN